ncbi:Coenzyme F420 hydrogenase/dehydrogenase, beta subunit C-terminal domain [uncultured Microbulbifer sp.]|uniref:Coenzyme F420 hydrogenase/dehydrogenase, beta subunit C-terminal domain n=1 Tax=uncultured Microbulbifer sp. TaxID=348147 RepID=UPI002632D574|nr:Coenzyme F420 hydrogenase/dehydrogenase, beta subunit C-terminal domain [uncultured Microbulbifer sp.]
MLDNIGATSNIEKVISGGYCIGCGACAVQDGSINIQENAIGLPQARLMHDSKHGNVCPFGSVVSEDEIAKSLYEVGGHYDKRVGFYVNNYVGFVAESQYRKKASSGGVISWVLAELFQKGEIDGVIHVAEGRDSIFEYQVSESLGEIIKRSKSRYYPVHFNSVLKKVLGNGKKYVFVGVPCFVKSIRLLSANNKDVAESIKYCIAIFCGHLKTKAFAEMIAMQQGISPDAIASVDFRVKNLKKPANKYSSQVFFKNNVGEIEALPPVSTQKLYGLDWGLGYFKPKACDWCDDIAGETADLSCGDAWLPETVKDPLGTNIVIVRNRIIDNILKEGVDRGSLVLRVVSVDKVYESQAGNYRHRREGLSVRLKDAETQGAWTPMKRVKVAEHEEVEARRKKIYRLREKISRRSHFAFKKSKTKSNFILFMVRMLPFELYYYFLNKRLFRGAVKLLYQYAQYLIRRIK